MKLSVKVYHQTLPLKIFNKDVLKLKGFYFTSLLESIDLELERGQQKTRLLIHRNLSSKIEHFMINFPFNNSYEILLQKSGE